MTIKTDDFKTGVKIIMGLYILKILQKRPAYGNKMSEEIKVRTQNLFTPNPNALYPLLCKMEEDGFITGAWDHAVTRGKRVYTITDAGLLLAPALENKVRESLAEQDRKIAILREDLEIY